MVSVSKARVASNYIQISMGTWNIEWIIYKEKKRDAQWLLLWVGNKHLFQLVSPLMSYLKARGCVPAVWLHSGSRNNLKSRQSRPLRNSS